MYLLQSRTAARVRSAQFAFPGRWLGLLVLTFPGWSGAAPLTETQSLQLGLNRADFLQLLDSRVAAARGDLAGSKTWANPEFELSREVLGDETETGFWLRQRFDLSGRRALNRDAAKVGVSAAEAERDALRSERRALIRRHFYQTLHHHLQGQRLAHWVEKFTEVETAMHQREAAGDVSGYDRRRISREKVSLLAQQRHGQAGYAAAWQQLLGVMGEENSRNFDIIEGKLMPGEPPRLNAALDGLARQPALLQLQRQAETARLAARAAERGRIPEVTVGLGQKSVDGPGGNDSGLMLSAAVPLPLFDRRQGARQRAGAEARAAESEYQLALRQTRTDLRSLWQQARQLADNARLFRQQSVAASYELVRIAEVAYQNNEIGVLELIDAYRSALEAEITALRLALEARLTRIELDKLIEGVTP